MRECGDCLAFLYADDLFLCGELENDLGAIVGLKFNAGKSKVMVLNREEGLECEVHEDGIRLEHVSEFKYLGCVLDESDTDGAEFNRKVVSGRRVTGATRSLVNARGLQVDSCMRHFLCLFLCMAMRHCYGKRRRDLE